MDRIEYIEIEGKNYPLCFSLGAMEELADTYGGAQELVKKLGSAVEFGAYVKALSVLMKYGVARVRRTEEDVPDALSIEELRLILDVEDYPRIIMAVNNAMNKAQGHEIKGKPNGKGKKKEQ